MQRVEMMTHNNEKQDAWLFLFDLYLTKLEVLWLKEQYYIK